MPRKVPDRKSLTIILTNEEYESIKNLAAKSHTSMNEIGRKFLKQGLDGRVTEDNIDFLTPIIREQIKSVMAPMFERLASLNAKTCIQAGAAAYLSAEALSSFVPDKYQRSFVEAYDAARQKSIKYMSSGSGIIDLEK